MIDEKANYQDQQTFVYKVQDEDLLVNRLRRLDDFRRQYTQYCFEHCQLPPDECAGCPVDAEIKKSSKDIEALKPMLQDLHYGRSPYSPREPTFHLEQVFVENLVRILRKTGPKTVVKKRKFQLARYDEYCSSVCAVSEKICGHCPIGKEAWRLNKLEKERKNG